MVQRSRSVDIEHQMTDGALPLSSLLINSGEKGECLVFLVRSDVIYVLLFFGATTTLQLFCPLEYKEAKKLLHIGSCASGKWLQSQYRLVHRR